MLALAVGVLGHGVDLGVDGLQAMVPGPGDRGQDHDRDEPEQDPAQQGLRRVGDGVREASQDPAKNHCPDDRGAGPDLTGALLPVTIAQ